MRLDDLRAGEVDWPSLEMARGPREEMPALLRQLCSDDWDEHWAAYEELSFRLLAEGTVYEAAAHVAPFLLEIAAGGGRHGPTGAFSILSDLVCGDEERWFARPPDIAAMRAFLARLERMSPDDYRDHLLSKAAEARDDSERRALEFRVRLAGLDRHRASLRWWIDAIDAVSVGIPFYVATLGHDSFAMRIWAVKLLSWFGDEEPGHTIAVRAIADVLDHETDERVLMNAVMAAGVAGRAQDHDLIDRVWVFLDHPEPPVRSAAALSYAALVPRPGRRVIEQIYDCLFAGPEDLDWFVFAYRDMSAMAAYTVGRLDPENADDRVAALVVRWTAAGPDDDERFVRAILTAAFPGGPIAEGVTLADLDPAGRAAVEAILSSGRAGSMPVRMLLRDYNVIG
ncbi:hypothetical protein AB0F72_38310 [Actinoplanes sp. NPDC023936]|uniref:hypothetical protein n=1 Tax=Actinoplanes sp. NPDC023936 TaxID=3154910 RepID=UPI00340D2EF9